MFSKKIQICLGDEMMKRFSKFLFLLSEASGTLAASIYALILSFIIQDLIKSQFINSLTGNLGLAISVIVSFFAGQAVDKKSPWKIIFFSDIILLPLILGLLFILNTPFSYKVIAIILVDIAVIVLGEFDSISRPKYLRMIVSKNDLDSTIQYMNGIQTLFSIAGYLLVFLSIAFLPFNAYLLVILILYLVSGFSIFLLPKEPREHANQVQEDLHLIDGTKMVLRFLGNSKNNVVLHSTYILYMLRNQLVMSLLIYRIGQLNKSFDKIHIIGLGIVSGVGLGMFLNLLVSRMALARRKGFSNLLYIASVFFCLYIGRVREVESFYLLGLSIGLIFGAGLPLFNLISSERLLLTPKEIIGRSTSTIRMLSIVFVFVTSIFLNVIDKAGLHSIYFDTSAFITLITSFIFSKIDFRYTNSSD